MTVNDAPEQQVYAFGRSVSVEKRASGVFAMGGDVEVVGRVEGDVATLGGNVTQKKGAYIGGDVIVIGGTYKSEDATPLREVGRETVIFGFLEDELKDLGQNPSHILSPTLSLSFLAGRIVLALIWFIISMVVITIAPGAVGRAAARFQLTPLKVGAFGSAAFMTASILIIIGATSLPEFIAISVVAMCMLLLVAGYVFGRITLQVSLGKWVQRRFFPENNRSETLAILTGVILWTLILSVPYLWPIALFLIFAFGIGLIFTARNTAEWKKA